MCAIAVSIGCSSRQSRIQSLGIDADSLSEEIVEAFDRDGNAALSSAELEKLPPVNSNRSAYDTDGNGEITAEELAARFAEIFGHGVGVLPASCRVTRGGRPLAGAEVRFVPPKVLAGELPPASGITDGSGVTGLRLAPEDMPDNFPSPRAAVMRPGIYLVEVTHPDVQIPPQYNEETILGKEVFSAVLNGPPLPIDLKF
jgi:hypothetical protein